MDYHEFIGQVQHRAHLPSFEAATRATRVTLGTLGERLFGGEADNLAAQLPQEIGLYLTQTSVSESFDLEEFFRRVSIREGEELPSAIHHARAVLSVLRDAVSPTLIQKVCAQLPADYDRLFEAESER